MKEKKKAIAALCCAWLLVGTVYTQNVNQSLINTAVYTGSHINMDNYNSGWGMPIPMQVSHMRKDGQNPNLVHITMTDFGTAHAYTHNMPGSQITFENSNQTTFGFSSSSYTRPNTGATVPTIKTNNTINPNY
jgi:hypothetical protein